MRAVFLDRDGVLNRAIVRDGKPYPPGSLEDLAILPEAAPALARLKALEFLLLVVSNQPDVARGTQDRRQVEIMNAALAGALPIDEFFVCYHDDSAACDCRKPAPGLILRAARRHGVDLSHSFMIGDRWRDVAAGQRAGVRTVFIDYHYDERQPEPPADVTVLNLTEAVDWIVARASQGAPVLETSAALANPRLADLKVKIFADGADKAGIVELAKNAYVKGFTTNPTLMRKAGITDYEAFARDLLESIPAYPISFEVFADDNAEMLRQAKLIAAWSDKVYVKIPVTNTKRETTASVVRELTQKGIKVNVTALMTAAQVAEVCQALAGGAPAYVSVFAGRVADTGRDPLPIMSESLKIINKHPGVELIWASPRELLNIFHADSIGTHIITVTHDVLAKLNLVGKDLDEYSLDTVKMFASDAGKAGFKL